jgi:TRAP-type C4-dicarboxylate transport system permease small subunit
MTGLARLNLLLLQLAEKTVILFMGIIALVIPYEVFGRYVLGDMPMWSGEAATYSLVWVSMMGGAVGLRKGSQVGISLAFDKLPRRLAESIRLAGAIVMLAFLSAMIYYGGQQTWVNWRQISPAIGIPMALPYLALPTGFILMWLFILEEMLAAILAPKRGSNEC